MFVDEAVPANAGVLRYRRASRGESPIIAAPDSVLAPYERLGSHPDIVERLWDALGAALPRDCRCIVLGTPALVHPETGIVLAVALGTQYGLRLAPDALGDARQAGAKTITRWSDGAGFDIAAAFGPDWILGGWLPQEAAWCRRAYDASYPIV